jgi:hypothetical protein
MKYILGVERSDRSLQSNLIEQVDLPPNVKMHLISGTIRIEIKDIPILGPVALY